MNCVLWWLEKHMTAETQELTIQGRTYTLILQIPPVSPSPAPPAAQSPTPRGSPQTHFHSSTHLILYDSHFPFVSNTLVQISQKQRPLRFTFLVIVSRNMKIPSKRLWEWMKEKMNGNGLNERNNEKELYQGSKGPQHLLLFANHKDAKSTHKTECNGVSLIFTCYLPLKDTM